MINIAAPDIGSEEMGAVKEVLRSGMLAQGPVVSKFEENFAKYCGAKYAVALNNGTAALHCAIVAAGVGAGDEVITIPFSFIATVNTILMQAAKPVFVDIEPESFNIDYTKVEKAITKKTKAILPVDLYGQPYDYDPIRKIANRHKLKIIEDAAQAVGASYGKHKTGTLGDLSCFSLYATKNIMSGEGGVVATGSKTYADRIKQFRQHGMTTMNDTYEYTELGYNYRMTDLHAAIAVEQLKKTNKFNKLRQTNAAKLSSELVRIKGIKVPVTKPGRTHVFHQYTIRITDEFPLSRDEMANYLRSKGVGSGIYYPKPLHAYRHIAKLGYKLGDFPASEKAAREVLSLPIHPKVSNFDIDKIINTFKEVSSA